MIAAQSLDRSGKNGVSNEGRKKKGEGDKGDEKKKKEKTKIGRTKTCSITSSIAKGSYYRFKVLITRIYI